MKELVPYILTMTVAAFTLLFSATVMLKQGHPAVAAVGYFLGSLTVLLTIICVLYGRGAKDEDK